jgi:hypothetical protein
MRKRPVGAILTEKYGVPYRMLMDNRNGSSPK